jgi:hypothetical protein
MKTFLVLILFLFSLQAECQHFNDTSVYKSSVKVNLIGLPFKTITVLTDHKINTKNYLELAAGYHFALSTKSNKILFLKEDDPFWFYNRFKTSLGFNHFYNKHFYLGSFIQYRYSYFDKIAIEAYVDHQGEAYDEKWTISRFKNEVGAFVKLGYSDKLRHKLLIDYFITFGVNRMQTTEKVWSKKGFYDYLPGDYPIISKKISYPANFNIGVALGLFN